MRFALRFPYFGGTTTPPRGGGGVGGGVGDVGKGEEGEVGRRDGEERRVILRLLFLGEGDGGALASSFPYL